MPKGKPGSGYKPPGQRFLDEIDEFDRFDRALKMENAMRDALPDGDTRSSPALLKRLHEFQQENNRYSRSTVTLTLTLRSQMTLEKLENELAMKRGKVIDWLLAGFQAKMDELTAERKRVEESYQESMRESDRKAKRRRQRDDDDDDNDDEEK